MMGVFRLLLRLVITSQRDGFIKMDQRVPSGKELLEKAECLAAVNERSRRQKDQHMLADLQFAGEWITSHRLVLEALQLPDKYYQAVPAEEEPESNSTDLVEGDKEDMKEQTPPPLLPGQTLVRGPPEALPEWMKQDLPQELAEKVLGFDNYLVWLGRMSLNQEDDGGIYFLHPCLNHS